MGHKILGVTTSCSDLFFDSTNSVAWPGFRTPIRVNKKSELKFSVRRGQKGSNFESMTPESPTLLEIKSSKLRVLSPAARASPCRPSSIARARHGCEVQPGCESRLKVMWGV